MAKLLGRSIIGFREGVEASERFYGISPASGQPLEPGYSSATPAEVELAAQLAFPGIRSSYLAAIAGRKKRAAVKPVAESANAGAVAGLPVGAVLFETDAKSFLASSGLGGEIFGPTTLLVQDSSREQLLEIARGLEGHLTATILGTEQDLRDYADLVAILENKVGRLVFNGFPTVVEVSDAMVHGGPYPATSDGRSTSVGSQAIFRFARPACYQSFPDDVLPEELKDANPLGIWRMIDGHMTHEANPPALASRAS